eukprot:scaffold4869_cov183-Amphora_coffeaeformis.AAC.12
MLFLEQTVVKDKRRHIMWTDLTNVNEEVRKTLNVLRQFQELFSPNLDTSVETLETLKMEFQHRDRIDVASSKRTMKLWTKLVEYGTV